MGCGSKAKKAVKKGASDVKKTVTKAGEDIGHEAERTKENLEKAATAAAVGLSDPGAWLGYMIDPTTGMYMAAEKTKTTYDELATAEKEEFKAEAEANMAKATEAKAMEEQKKMVALKAKEAADTARERATRLGKGRRGLLYQGTGEQGVTKKSDVLGG